MSIDVRIDPEVSTAAVAGVTVRVSALLLGGIPRGAAIIVGGPDGLGPVEAVDTVNALAQHGYESVMAEPVGVGHDDDFARELVHHLVDRVAARGWTHEQTGVIGYGQGARAALIAGSEATFGAAISVPRDTRQFLRANRITALQTPWLGMTGLGSHSDFSEELSVYRDEVEAASTAHTSLIWYPGLDHCLHDSVDALVHQAAFDTWQRTAEWLNIHVEPRPTPLAEAWRERQKFVQPAAH